MKKGLVCIFLATLLFSSMESVLKLIAGQFNPVQMTWLRFLVGGVVLLPLALSSLRRRKLSIHRRDIVYFCLLGLVGIVISMTLYQLAVIHADAAIVAVLFSSNPLFVVPLAALLLRTPIHRYHIAALALDITGILLIINPFHVTIPVAGIVFSLLAPIFFALYSVMGKQRTDIGGLANTCFGFLAGSAEMGLLMLLSHIPVVSGCMKAVGLGIFADIPFFSGISAENLLVVFYASVCVTGIGYASYFLAIEYTTPVTASLTFFLKPAIAPFFAMAILGEQLSFLQIAGICVIIAGSLVNLLFSLKTTEKPAA